VAAGHRPRGDRPLSSDQRRPDRPGTYIELIAFPDFASPMGNSEDPVTNEFAKRMHEATEGEAGFRNLDVRELMRM
jgi:hypothetical protein